MGRHERRAYLKAVWSRYQLSDRASKKVILDEFCAVCGYNRKYAISLLRKPLLRASAKRKPGRKSKYCDPQFLEVLRNIWKASDYMCSRRLKAVIPVWLPHYEREHKSVDDKTRSLLLTASAATLTLDCVLRQHRVRYGKGRCGTKPGTLLRTQMRNLPFKLRGFDCDNGAEFLNHHLVRYFSNRKAPVDFTRSRPYQKNDNAHVEQKNWTHPRHLLGYDRIEDSTLIHAINDLYANEWALYQNHFCPSMKPIAKSKINSKYKKTYDNPITSYQRLINSGKLSQKSKTQLTRIHKNINPFKLKKIIEQKLNTIFTNIKVSSNVRLRV